MRFERRDGYLLCIGGPVPRGADGITVRSLVIVRDGREDSGYLLRHEQVHVRQWKRYGNVGFLARYIGAYLGQRLRRRGHHNAYLRIPFEIEADWVARRTAPRRDDASATNLSVAR